MSFVLKDLSPDEFCYLQNMVGQNIEKIQQATSENYQNLPFTATEYEQLKKALEQHQQDRLTSFFYTSPANAIANKLRFDFKSLITALNTYVTNYDRWNPHDREAAWLNVGQAQREVPVHIANEYCRLDRLFYPCPDFNERVLPRVLRLDDSSYWFPLTSSSSGLGFDFGLAHGVVGAQVAVRAALPGWRARDSAVVTRLDKVRTADLTQSREILDVATASIYEM